MRKCVCFLAVIAICLGALPAQSRAAADEFVIQNGILQQYTGSGGNVVIPDGVTAIEDRAFSFKGVTSVTFPESLIAIGNYAFMDGGLIEIVNFPSSIRSLGREAVGWISPDTAYEIRVKIWRLMDEMPLDPSECVAPQSISITETSDEIASELETEYDKAEAICKWVAENIRYDTAQFEMTKPFEEYSSVEAEDVLATRMTTCEGYANLTVALLNAQGIPAVVCDGIAESYGEWGGHAWNEVYVDGRWLQADTTFGHYYFDMDIAEFAKDHILWNRPISVGTSRTEKENCDSGHTWGEWETIQDAGCGSAGKEERACAVCGRVETRDTLALQHDYREVSSGTGASWQRVNGKMVNIQHYTDVKYECRNCGDSYSERVMGELENPWGIHSFTIRDRYDNGLFEDVDSSQWFGENVAVAYELGLMKGTGAGSFSPNSNVTLAEAVTLAARIHSIYFTGAEDFFSYGGGNWYDPYVAYARANGIPNAYADYAQIATREEFVHILARALPREELESVTGQLSFADSAEITYLDDVDLLSAAGVIHGIRENGQTCFKPHAAITRAEVAAIVGRMVQPATRGKI